MNALTSLLIEHLHNILANKDNNEREKIEKNNHCIIEAIQATTSVLTQSQKVAQAIAYPQQHNPQKELDLLAQSTTNLIEKTNNLSNISYPKPAWKKALRAAVGSLCFLVAAAATLVFGAATLALGLASVAIIPLALLPIAAKATAVCAELAITAVKYMQNEIEIDKVQGAAEKVEESTKLIHKTLEQHQQSPVKDAREAKNVVEEPQNNTEQHDGYRRSMRR